MPITSTLRAIGLGKFAPIVLGIILSAMAIMTTDHREVRRITASSLAPNPVRPGETALLIFTAVDYRACYGRTTRWIVDAKGLQWLLTDYPVEFSQDFYKPHQFVRELPIPRGISIGPATYHARVERWCNTLQGMLWPMTNDNTVEFQVK